MRRSNQTWLVPCIAACVLTPADAQVGHTDSAQQGSVLILPHVEVRWSASGQIVQDTFIQLNNNFPGAVSIQLYYVNGDPPSPADPQTGERQHSGWNAVDDFLDLTQNQPTYWSAATGLPAGRHPWGILDPGTLPGHPASDGSGDRVLRGYIVAWAVDWASGGVYQQISFNFLTATATVVNYAEQSAWQYSAMAFFADRDVPRFTRMGSPGLIQLNGTEFEACPSQLIVPFTAAGGSFGRTLSAITSDASFLTLMSADMDFRQESAGPTATAVMYEVWNSNETKLAGLSRCLTCWDYGLLSGYGTPDLFTRNALGTDEGWARLDGQSASTCPGSSGTALLGVLTQSIRFANPSGIAHERAANTLGGLGAQAAVIKYKPIVIPPEDFRSTEQPVARAAGIQDRAKANAPGSVLIYPRVELRWDAAGALVRDTYVELINEGSAEVQIRLYYVHGDPALAADPDTGERAHAGWGRLCGALTLTPNQPINWSTSSGLPAGVPGFEEFDPGPPVGRPARDGSAERILRGYLVLWAVNSAGEEIHWNHLSGRATVVDVNNTSAWSYSPVAAAALNQGGAVGPGDTLGTPFILQFDGSEYTQLTSHLLMNFFLDGSPALSGGVSTVTNMGDLTLLVVPSDLRSVSTGPVHTKVVFQVWNAYEFKLTGMSRCVSGWDQELLQAYAEPNFFLDTYTQTTCARAMLWGEANASCPGSVAAPLLAVLHSDVTFNGSARAATGELLPVLGTNTTPSSAIIQVDPNCGSSYQRPGDCDLDGDVDLEDVGSLQRCLGASSGNVPPRCVQAEFERLDVAANGVIDLYDYAVIQDHWIGPR